MIVHFLHQSLILKRKQNRIELVIRLDEDREMSHKTGQYIKVELDGNSSSPMTEMKFCMISLKTFVLPTFRRELFLVSKNRADTKFQITFCPIHMSTQVLHKDSSEGLNSTPKRVNIFQLFVQTFSPCFCIFSFE